MKESDLSRLDAEISKYAELLGARDWKKDIGKSLTDFEFFMKKEHPGYPLERNGGLYSHDAVQLAYCSWLISALRVYERIHGIPLTGLPMPDKEEPR